MSTFESIKLAIKTLFTNKLRSFLTMLGIIIGISAVITITTIGESIKTLVSAEFNSLGTNVIWIYQELFDEEIQTDYYVFSEDIINDFEKKNPGFHYMQSSELYGSDNDLNYNVKVLNYGAYEYNDFEILSGRSLSMEEFSNNKYVCLITLDMAKNYFKEDSDYLGKSIYISTEDLSISNEFVVVGIYKEKETLYNYTDEDNNTIIIPSDLVTLSDDSIYYPYFYYDSTVMASETTNIVSDYFNNIIKDENITFYYENVNDEIDSILSVISVITIAISVISSIALIVGGVGVMNIMLVSVVERTKEIGILKAIGAKNKDIKRSFLIESIVICLVGCFIGTIIGLVNGYLLAKVASPLLSSYLEVEVNFSITPSYTAIIISCLFSTLIGVFFGLYPASKASKLDPITALRYE